MKETAHVAYDAYGDFVEWKNFRGDPMPKWNDLPERIKNAWRAANGAVNAMSSDLDRILVQLAGCGVAALGGTGPDQVATADMWGWSPAYAEVVKLRRAFDMIAGGRSPDQILEGTP